MAFKLPHHAKGSLFGAHYLKKSSKHTAKSILSFLTLLRKQIDEKRYMASLLLMLIFSVE